MDTIVMKFGGSSVADNDKLKLVAKKIIDLYNNQRPHQSISYMVPALVHQANIKTERRWKNYYRKKNVLNEEVPIFDPKCKGIAGLKHSIPDNVKLR